MSMKKKVLLFILLILFLVISQGIVIAQTQGNIRINLVSTQERQDDMLLKVYFNLLEPSTGKIFTSLNADNAQITLLHNGYVSPATIKEPDVPVYITLLLDSSASMGENAKKMQQAAQLSLNNPPDDSYFGVVQFDEEIRLLQDFTQNIPAVSYSIDQYKVSNKGTCLYDAAYATVEAQANAPTGRRGIILFTDGNDAKPGAERCSKHTYQELIAYAMSMQVPIHTIGLTGFNSQINEVELRSMAASTGGFSYIAQEEDLAEAFVKIVDTIKAQWMVEANVYPKEGTNEAVFLLSIVDGETINTAFSFESDTEYVGPPSPVQMRFDGLVLNVESQDYNVQMTLTSPELVNYVKIALWDSDAGAKLSDFVFENPDEYNVFDIPTNEMTADRDYELRIIAVSKGDNIPFAIYTDDQGKRITEYIHEFRFDPSSMYAQVAITSVTQRGSDLILNVDMSNRARIGGFDGWLVDKTTNTQVAGSTFHLPVNEVKGNQIIVPTRQNKVPSGKYQIVLRVLNAHDQVLMTTSYDDVVYTAPSLFKRISTAMIAKPIFIFAIIGIIGMVVIFMMVTASRQKSLTGTPVMQGRLGKSQKNKAKQNSYMAIANEEPIPQRKTSSPPPQQSSSQKSVAQKSTVKKPTTHPEPTQITPNQPDPTLIETAYAVSTPTLAGIKGPITGTLVIEKFPYTIGRAECDLEINVASVSRRHAQITDLGNGQYAIKDLNSSNGTKLDGNKITPGQNYPLKNGSFLDFGKEVTLRFEVR